MTNRRISHAEPAASHSAHGYSGENRAGAGLLINVVFTTIEGTLSALRHAGAMANDLGAVVRVLVAEAVPYPLPLNRPPVAPAFRLRQFRLLSCHGAVAMQIELRLCRDTRRCLRDALARESLIVIGGKRGWFWPTRATRLARLLRKLGHHVVFVPED